MLGHQIGSAARPQLPRLPRAAGPDHNQENNHPDERDRLSKVFKTWKQLALVRIPGHGLGLQLLKPKGRGLATFLRVLFVNDEQSDVSPWNTTGEQAACTVCECERVGENAKKLPVPRNVESEDASLDFNSAALLPETRRPLVPPDSPKDASFASLTKDMSVLLEPEEKPPNINEVPDYREDIYLYFREIEVRFKPPVNYLEKQPDVTKGMRAALVDWLVMAGEENRLQNETLHLAVNYIDRFLSSLAFQGEFQLLGTAALLLASKFEEVYPLTIAEVLHLTDKEYCRREVLRMEQLLLKVLAFDLAAPTVNRFLTQYFLQQQLVNSRVESLAMFLGELSLMDADLYLKYLPSVISGAAFHLALYTITGKSWPESLIQKTGYTLESLKPCLMDLHQTFLRAPQQVFQCIQDKYKMARYQGVSLINPPETLSLE